MNQSNQDTLYECIQRETFVYGEEVYVHHLSWDKALGFSRKQFKGLDARLLSDKDFVLKALEHTQEKEAFYFIDPCLQDDYDIVGMCLNKGMIYWSQISRHFQHDKHLAFCAVCGDIESFAELPAKFRLNREFAWQCWTHKIRHSLEYGDLHIELLKDLLSFPEYRMQLDLIDQSFTFKKQSCMPSNELKLGIILQDWGHDAQFMQSALKIDLHFYGFIKPLLSGQKRFYKKVYDENPQVAGYLFLLCEGELIYNREYAKNACLLTGANVYHLTEHADKQGYYQEDFYREIMEQKPIYYQYLSEKWRNNPHLLAWTVEHCFREELKDDIMKKMGSHLQQILNESPKHCESIAQKLQYLKRYDLHQKLENHYETQADEAIFDEPSVSSAKIKI